MPQITQPQYCICGYNMVWKGFNSAVLFNLKVITKLGKIIYTRQWIEVFRCQNSEKFEVMNEVTLWDSFIGITKGIILND